MFVLSSLCNIIKLGLSRRGEKVKFRLPCPNIINRIALRKGQFMGKFIDLAGKKFGRLTVIKRIYNNKNATYWLCKCECGKEKIIRGTSLTSNNTKSCGCLLRDKAKLTKNIKHGKSNTRIYKIYCGIKKRCYCKTAKNYYLYGARNIKMCEKWLESFENFYNWAVNNGYQDNLTIDRIDTNGNYCPENCRWVDMKTQANNTRRNHYIEYNGIKHSIAEWSRILEINYGTLKSRIKYGWSLERIFNGI